MLSSKKGTADDRLSIEGESRKDYLDNMVTKTPDWEN
jgi:hypothetical protein